MGGDGIGCVCLCVCERERGRSGPVMCGELSGVVVCGRAPRQTVECNVMVCGRVERACREIEVWWVRWGVSVCVC